MALVGRSRVSLRADRWPLQRHVSRASQVSYVARLLSWNKHSRGMSSVTTTSSLTVFQNPRLGAVMEQ